MSELGKVTDRHRQRRAVVYVRQSTPGQVVRNTESAARQYALAERAVELGWPAQSVLVVDEDTGRSAAWAHARIGFRELVAEVGLGHVGVILALEVSRLARSGADWHAHRRKASARSVAHNVPATFGKPTAKRRARLPAGPALRWAVRLPGPWPVARSRSLSAEAS